MQSYGPQALLEKYQEGFRVDIHHFSHINHQLSHIDAEVTFIQQHE
jgi:hypothetical protein